MLILSYFKVKFVEILLSKFVLQNFVFQRTVLGPTLWNIFFADVHGPAEQNGAKERRFADDLSYFQAVFSEFKQ